MPLLFICCLLEGGRGQKEVLMVIVGGVERRAVARQDKKGSGEE